MTYGVPVAPRCATSRFIKGVFIDEVPLHTLGRIERAWGNVLGAPTTVGTPFHIPLRSGMLDVQPIPSFSDFSVDLTLYGERSGDGPGFHSAWRDLARLVWHKKTPLVVRRDVEFSDGVQSHACAARYVSGLEMTTITDSVVGMGRTSLRFRNIDAYWYNINQNIDLVLGDGSPHTIQIPGDVPTSRMNLEFSGGTEGQPQVLTNNTNSVSVVFGGDTATYNAILNVQEFTAVQNGKSVLSFVSHSGAYQWMVLEPGENELVLENGGQVQITSRSAFL